MSIVMNLSIFVILVINGFALVWLLLVSFQVGDMRSGKIDKESDDIIPVAKFLYERYFERKT